MVLEWKTRVKEEGWKTELFANARHDDWPGEWCGIYQVYSERKLIGYECNFKLYKSLQAIVSAGWELIWSHHPANRKVYEAEIFDVHGYSAMKQLKLIF
jgi:hypothetical protein